MRYRIVGIFLLLISGCTCVSTSSPRTTESVAARSVLHRVIGQRVNDFTFESLPRANDNLDIYDIQAANGKVTIRGNTTVAMCRGAYDYLRNSCHCMFTWEGEHMDLPAKLPDLAETRVESPYSLRQYDNVCTFGYTSPYWDWNQWEHEIDWMALHGINMPLAEVGTEAIWRRVWLSMGITQKELDKYFTGPAFMPWHRMGNIDRWDGPPPSSWFDKQIVLEKKIVARMRELGMQPIAPAFAGFVPREITRVHPETKITELASWAQFSDPYRTYLLDPTSPLYKEIGRRFIQDWEKEFGENKYFLADSFNELKVPVPPDRAGRLSVLAKYGDAVYQSIIAGEPKATWVMQGWLFFNDAEFWDQDSTAALLSKIPDDRMIILDLACDFRPIWSAQKAFYGKQWIYSVIHNMGGKTTIGGKLDFFATDPAHTLAAPNHGRLVGFGLAPEGTENNEVVYELLTDAMWTSQPIDLDTWLPSYCQARYGACPDAMSQAWKLLCQSAYKNEEVAHERPGYVHRPDLNTTRWGDSPNDSPEYRQAVKLFLQCDRQLENNALFRADAMDLTAQYAGSRIDELLLAALKANRTGDAATRDRCAAQAIELMSDVDALLANHPINRLDRWVAFARSWGDTEAEKDYYEADAKRLITTWGGGPGLSEYASKTWNGLIESYYRARWQILFDDIKNDKEFAIRDWEEKWIRTPIQSAAPGTGDVLEQCHRIIAKADSEK